MTSVIIFIYFCFILIFLFFFFFQAEDGIRDDLVTGVQTCALPICANQSTLRRTGLVEKHAPAARVQRFVGHVVSKQLPSCRATVSRSEERRVGKECRSRWSADQ